MAELPVASHVFFSNILAGVANRIVKRMFLNYSFNRISNLSLLR